MDKTDFLADDFEQVAKGTDDAVFEMLKKSHRSTKASPRKSKPMDEQTKKSAPKNMRQRSDHAVRTNSQIEPQSWGKPVPVLNTRIPQELSGLLDDYIYEAKKRGEPTTKQAIAIG